VSEEAKRIGGDVSESEGCGGLQDPATRSEAPVTDSLAWSRVDFWESGVTFSLAYGRGSATK
jgi:hypothetical protein